MENPPPNVVQMFHKLHTARRAAVDGKLTSSHYHDIDCAIVEVLEQLSPVFVKSAEGTRQGDLPAEQPVAADSGSAKKLQALLADHDGPLGNLAKDDQALGVLQDLFPSLQGRGELEEMLATIENVRKDVSKVEVQDAPTVSGGGEAKVQITSPGHRQKDHPVGRLQPARELWMGRHRQRSGAASPSGLPRHGGSPSGRFGEREPLQHGRRLGDMDEMERVGEPSWAPNRAEHQRKRERNRSTTRVEGRWKTRECSSMQQPQPPAPPLLVASKWARLRESQREAKVPVALFVLCKTVVEDDQGALYLNATVVQRVPLETTRPTPPQEQLEQDLLFQMRVKGPSAGGGITIRRRSVEDVRGRSQHTVMVCETLDLKTVPLDVRNYWNWFPFRILKATIDLELQAKNVDVGRTKVLFCPDLCASNIKDNVAKVQTRGSFSRSSKLTFLQEEPLVHIVQDRRFKKGLGQEVKDGHKLQAETFQADVEEGRAPTVADPDDNLFVTYPLMRLTFYLYEPPAKAMFKVVGPLFLVLYLMLMNFNEFYGLRNIWDDGCPGEERDSDYLANGIGIAITAAFVVPAIRADRMKSPYISFTRDDLMAVAFLLGLALSTSPYCRLAISGCFVSFLVVVSAVVASVRHYFKCKHLKKTAAQHPPVIVEASSKEIKAAGSEFDMREWFHASV